MPRFPPDRLCGRPSPAGPWLSVALCYRDFHSSGERPRDRRPVLPHWETWTLIPKALRRLCGPAVQAQLRHRNNSRNQDSRGLPFEFPRPESWRVLPCFSAKIQEDTRSDSLGGGVKKKARPETCAHKARYIGDFGELCNA